MQINTVEEALAVLEEIQSKETPSERSVFSKKWSIPSPTNPMSRFELHRRIENPQERETSFDWRWIKLSNDFTLRIEIPRPAMNSSINTPYMEAFLEIQRQFYQLAALLKSGIADAGVLSEEDKRNLDFSVIVQNGSSIFTVLISDAVQSAVNDMVSKMSGTEITIVTLGLTLLLCATWGINSYVSKMKDVKMEEIKSREHVAALEAFSSAKNEEKEHYELIRELLHESGELGKKAWNVAEKSFDAVIKAASKTNESIINGVHLTRQEAKALRATAREQSKKCSSAR